MKESNDPLERDVAKVLSIYQDIKASNGQPRTLGYEPRDFRKNGITKTIESRVRNKSSGFESVPAEHSYESIVLRYSDRFSPDVVRLAKQRLSPESDLFEATGDEHILDQRVNTLLSRKNTLFPKGSKTPRSLSQETFVYERDPAVKAKVLELAGGKCQMCRSAAPFRTETGFEYLEVHHVKPLANGGSDRVQNAAAICPNCHRALHYAADAEERTAILYQRNQHLVPE